HAAFTILTPKIKRFDAALSARRWWKIRVAQIRKTGRNRKLPPAPPPVPTSEINRYYYAGVMRSYISTILPLKDGKMMIGHYGAGVSIGHLGRVSQSVWGGMADTIYSRIADLLPGSSRNAKLPLSAKVPSVNQMVTLLGRLMRVRPNTPNRPSVIPLTDDWRTQGNWIDHYGRMWSLLYAMTGLDEGGGYDDVCFLRSDAWVNTCWRRHEAARHWLVTGWRNSTDPRVLQDLLHGGRTQSNADDHGETYPDTIDGPNLYETIELPVGQYVFSVYLLNDDGHAGYDRNRDYILQLSETSQLARKISRIGWYQKNHIQPVEQFNRSRPTAFSRCQNFWGGVYKRFYVRVVSAGVRYRGLNMGCITLCIHRNYSFNTICEGLFIDPLGRLPFIRYGRVPRGVPEQPPMKLEYKQPIPAFQKGQPYIPTTLGLPRPGHPFIVMHVKAMPRYVFDAGAILQQLLYLRHTNRIWFAQNGFMATTELARFITGFKGDAGFPATYFYKRPPQAIYSGRFLASLLRGVGLSSVADSIYPPMSRYMPARDEYWGWEERTKHPKITDQKIWPLPQIFKLYHAWWEKQWHKCLTWEDPQWATN
ncbi:MAG: hypothetical protein M0Z50_03725, partial [Planctomycetia bacterium]|nr:hypothetical protein [Planctomycetia bacterium]